jgi:hypothetical protein
MKKQLLVIGHLLIWAVFPAFSQKYSNEFLSIGIGGRAHGMSGAQVAVVNDITSAYWNPAGLASIDAPYQAAAMHAEWFGGVGQYDYLSFGKSMGGDRNAFLAFSLIRLGIDNIPYTINLVNTDGTINYDNVTEFSAADYALMGSYARKLKNPALSVGGTVKVVRRVIGKFGNSWGFGADFGIQYKKGNLQFGMQGRDLTTTFNAWSFNLTEQEKAVFSATNNDIPVSNTEITRPRVVLGGAYKIKCSSKTTLLPTVDLECTTDGQRNVLISSKGFNLDARVGMEADYRGLVQVRLGAGNFQRTKADFNAEKEYVSVQPNFGIGLHIGRVQLDYALTDIGNVSAVQYSHIFSFRLDIKARKKAGE